MLCRSLTALLARIVNQKTPKMKVRLILLVVTLLNFGAVFSQVQNQARSEVGLKASTQFLNPFFLAAHQTIYKNDLSAFEVDYRVKTVFSIDTSGSLVNLTFENDDLPETVKSYVKKLLSLTEGLWQPEIMGGTKVISPRITGIFILTSQKLSFNERTARTERMLKEAFGGKHVPELEENIFDDKRKYFFAVFLGY